MHRRRLFIPEHIGPGQSFTGQTLAEILGQHAHAQETAPLIIGALLEHRPETVETCTQSCQRNRQRQPGLFPG